MLAEMPSSGPGGWVVTVCHGLACVCPSVPTHYPDCFVISGWIALISVAILSLVVLGFAVRSIFLTSRASLSAPQRLQRQRNFWIVLFSVIAGQALVAVTMHQSAASYITVLVLATIVGIGYIMWSRFLKA